MQSYNTYQDILSLEEEEERNEMIWEKQRQKQEKAERLAECKENED